MLGSLIPAVLLHDVVYDLLRLSAFVLYEGRRVEKCILLERLSKFMHGVQSRDKRSLLSSRTSRTVGHMDCRVVRVE